MPTRKPVRPPTLGLVLSGGGARGAFQVGVIDRLLEDRRFAHGPSVLSGTSAGGINSALLAAGKSPTEMMDFWRGIGADPPVIASHLFFEGVLRGTLRLTLGEIRRWLSGPRLFLAFLQRLRNHLSPLPASQLALWTEYLLTQRFELVSRLLETIREPYLADTTPLRERLIDALGGERVPSRGVRLAINTVDAHTGQVVRFVSAPSPATRSPEYVIVEAITVDMILATASIPLLFPPVAIGKHLCWDGGLLVNTPLAPVVALGAEEIVTVLVTEAPDRKRGQLQHFGRAVERTVDSFLDNAYNVDRKLLLERNRLARLQPGDGTYRAVTLYEAVRPERAACFNAGSYLYFEPRVLDSMYQQGRRAATKWLAAGPVVDHLDEPQLASNA
jgi:predicted acylesterase/phospholipase RssA